MRIFFQKPIKPTEKTRLSIFLDCKLKDRLRTIAQEEEISLNHVVRIFLEIMVGEHSKMVNLNDETCNDSPWLYD